SIMPTAANSTNTGSSPLYSPRSRMKVHAKPRATAETTSSEILSTSAMPSRTNMSCITEPCPPTPAASMHAATSSTPIAPTWVTIRRRSSMNRSSISSANAPSTTNSSGASGAMSASPLTCGVITPSISTPGVIAASSSKLACGELCRQLRDGGLHQVGQRLRPDTDQQDADGEHAEHDPFAAVDVLQLRDVGVADVAPDHPLGQPQRVAGAGHQRGRRGERDQRMVLEAGQDHHELADEAAGAGQAGVRHREEDPERREPGHHVGDAAV